jgi:hypothetical protein
LGSGTKPYRLVSNVSKLSLVARAIEETNLVKLSTLDAAMCLVREPGFFT